MVQAVVRNAQRSAVRSFGPGVAATSRRSKTRRRSSGVRATVKQGNSRSNLRRRRPPSISALPTPLAPSSQQQSETSLGTIDTSSLTGPTTNTISQRRTRRKGLRKELREKIKRKRKGRRKVRARVKERRDDGNMRMRFRI